jgi:hypothetical protein
MVLRAIHALDDFFPAFVTGAGAGSAASSNFGSSARSSS